MCCVDGFVSHSDHLSSRLELLETDDRCDCMSLGQLDALQSRLLSSLKLRMRSFRRASRMLAIQILDMVRGGSGSLSIQTSGHLRRPLDQNCCGGWVRGARDRAGLEQVGGLGTPPPHAACHFRSQANSAGAHF